ncbi:MAG: molybdenum cofactor guanylyltransferase [Terracidiphilus sp.]
MSLPHPLLPMTPDAFILAGGQSTRMGYDKALTLLAGVPLVQHACNLIRSAGLNPCIAGAQSNLSSFAPTLPDDPTRSGLGPLSGICSALANASAPLAVFLPVDLPLLPASLIVYLLHHATVSQSVVTVVSVAGFIQTFPAIIDTAALASLQSSLNSNDRNSLRAFRTASSRLSRPLAVLPVELLLQAGQVSSPQAIPPGFWFLNINAPQDLRHAEALLAGR